MKNIFIRGWLRLCRVFLLVALALSANTFAEWRKIALPNHEDILDCTDAPDGTVWAAGTNGLLVSIVNDSVTDFSYVTSENICTISVDSDGVAWIGGDSGGIYRYLNGQWEAESIGIETNTIYDIEAINCNDIWISCDDRLVHFNGSSWNTILITNWDPAWCRFLHIQPDAFAPGVVYVLEACSYNNQSSCSILRVTDSGATPLKTQITGSIRTLCASSNWNIWYGDLKYDGVLWTRNSTVCWTPCQTFADGETWFLCENGIGQWDGFGIALYPCPENAWSCSLSNIFVQESGRLWLFGGLTYALYYCQMQRGLHQFDFQFRLNPTLEDMTAPSFLEGDLCQLDAYLWNNSNDVQDIDVYILVEAITYSWSGIHVDQFFFPDWTFEVESEEKLISPWDWAHYQVLDFIAPTGILSDINVYGIATTHGTYTPVCAMGKSTFSIGRN